MHDNNPFRSILIFGPPGAGKGTLGKFLSTAGNHFHLSSGDIFRGLDQETRAGSLYHTYASKGHLVPDEVTVEIWRQYVSGLIATNKYFPNKQFLLLDGIPRTSKQAEIFDQYIDVAHIIVLEMGNIEGLIGRMKKRAFIEKRSDDSDENVLRTRMHIYEKDTKSVLAHYPEHLISRFNADQKPLEVLRDVLLKLSDLLSYPEKIS
ncbi:MAG: nucleoside monophosphate kinase [Chlamydiae bacterium]|nr:nucleoside monophosphate kinase [Chlamydiota bacterium]